MNDYNFTPEMGEISGFGGSYEAGCRAMLKAGCKWLDEHPKADPRFHSYTNLYGIITEDNEDAKALTKAVMDAEVIMDDGKKERAGAEATGAMHQAVISAILYIKRAGWPAYAKAMMKESG